MMWLRRIIISLPLVLVAFFVLAFISVRLSTPRKLNQFVSGSIGEPETLNPILSTTTAAAEVQGRIFNGLIRYDENLEVVGDLAKSWEIRQNSRWFFDSEAKAQQALERVLAHRPSWTAFSLEEAKRSGCVLELRFGTAGTSYRDELTKWIGEIKPEPVTFLMVNLESDKKFPDGAPVRSELVLERLRAPLKRRPELEQRVVYTWTGGMSGYAEIVVFGMPEEIAAMIGTLLTAADAQGKQVTLGTCQPDEPLPCLDEPEITFYLRPGVRWHDGQPFTSEDVLFTYECLMNEAIASPRRSDYELVRELVTPDQLTVRVTYKKPYAPALLSWGMSMLPKHILGGKSSAWWAEHYNRKPVGTGPFIFEYWKTNEIIRLRRNPDYWEGPPHLDSIAIRSIPDALALRLSFETREVDVLGVEPFALGTMQKNPDYEIFSRLVPMYSFVGWNLRRPLFQDRRVRTALAHAVNVPEIIRYVLYGQGVQSNGTFPPQMWYANKEIVPYAYDTKRARELLAEAGWSTRDKDGWLTKDGKRFEFTLITNQGNEVRKDVATLIQQQLKQLGIKVNVEIYEWAVFIKNKIDAQDFDACVLGWSLGYDYDQYQLWHSSQSKPGALNFCSYNNPRVDRLLALARGEFDRERARRYCHEIQRLIYEDQPYLFLYVPMGITALHRGVFRVNRPSEDGRWIDEPIRPTKAGIGIYDTWWYRTTFGTRHSAALTP